MCNPYLVVDHVTIAAWMFKTQNLKNCIWKTINRRTRLLVKGCFGRKLIASKLHLVRSCDEENGQIELYCNRLQQFLISPAPTKNGRFHPGSLENLEHRVAPPPPKKKKIGVCSACQWPFFRDARAEAKVTFVLVRRFHKMTLTCGHKQAGQHPTSSHRAPHTLCCIDFLQQKHPEELQVVQDELKLLLTPPPPAIETSF